MTRAAAPEQTLLMLPYPPSVNHYWTPVVRFNSRTRMHYAELVLSAKAKQYRESAGWLILSQRPREHCWPYKHAVVLTLKVSPPDQHVRDRDNILKAVLDVLVTSGVLADDSLVQEIHLYSSAPQEGGMIEVCIEAMRPTDISEAAFKDALVAQDTLRQRQSLMAHSGALR